MAAEAKPAKKPMPKLPFQSKASEPKPAVSEPRPLEAQGEPAADDKSVAKDQSEKKEDHPDGLVRLAFVTHFAFKFTFIFVRIGDVLLLRPPPAVTPVERRPMLSTILFEINVLMLLSQAPMASSQAWFLFCAICLHKF